ncbi:MAG TPA: choice-of-anchor Q domain-containing protein [Phycisphaerales bacterium]|nr:choice-of-anchor Q domain-containing protein [Phycisphaerales bacterium]
MPRRPTSADSVRLEPLEERRLLATYMVDSPDDVVDGDYGEGQLTFREAVELSNTAEGEDTIHFVPGLDPITLTSDLTLTDDAVVEWLDELGNPTSLGIHAQGAAAIVADDGDDDRSIHVTIRGFRTYDSLNGQPISIRARENLTLLDSIVTGDFDSSFGHHVTQGIEHSGTTPDAFFEARRCQFRGIDGGEAVLSSTGAALVIVDACEISDSEVGAIAVRNAASVIVTNSTISGNTSQTGVAGFFLDLPDGVVVVSNCTIASNRTTDGSAGLGGGVVIAAGTLRLNSTILAYNRLGGAYSELTIVPGAALDLPGSRNNLVYDAGSAGWLIEGLRGNILGHDPGLGGLGEHGGRTRTISLREGSPAIDAGNNDLGLATDQRGDPFARSEGAADIGAYEAQELGLIVDSPLDTDDGDYSAGNLTLREAVELSNANDDFDETILFDPALQGATIVVGREIRIFDTVEIEGPGADLLKLDGLSASRIFGAFGIHSLLEVTLRGLWLTRGLGGGGAIFTDSDAKVTLDHIRVTECAGGSGAIANDRGSVFIYDSEITNNHAEGSGGAISNTGWLRIWRSTISDNTAAGDGGAIATTWKTWIIDSTLDGNAAAGNGGAIWAEYTLTLSGCVFGSNTASKGGGAISLNRQFTFNVIDASDTRFEANHAGWSGGAVAGRGRYFDCAFINNSADADGGAVSTTQSPSFPIVRSTFVGNRAGGRGGAVVAYICSIEDSSFERNTAGDGGALFVLASAQVTDCRFALNDAASCGGAILASGNLDLRAATFSTNTAQMGGAIFNQFSLTAEHCSFERNTATSRGGVLYNDGSQSGNAAIERSLLVDNAARDDGGAVWSSGPLGLTNCTLSGNDAGGSGGALAIAGGTTTLRFCTVAHNTSQEAGGAAYIDNRSTDGLLVTRSSLYAQNRAGAVPDTFAAAGAGAIDESSDHNLVDSALGAGGLIDGLLGNIVGVNPRITELGEYGGPTRAHALEPASPAIDAAGDAVDTDQRGIPRPVGAGADIGAYESGVPLARDEAALAVSSGADAVHRVVAWSVDGSWLVLSGSGDSWMPIFLGDEQAPQPIGDAAAWTGPSGRGVVAGPSEAGLLLFEEQADGRWTLRNLAAELGVVTDSPVRALTTIRTRAGLMIVAGYNASGEIVAFREMRQNGARIWTFLNISDDLADQNMSTPDLDELVGYATPWDAWNLAGIDDSGDIQAIWVDPSSFTSWRLDNLSALTGAGPLTGPLTVTQTVWNAINLGGLNADGRLMVTWWVPGGNWATSDLSGASDAPTLVANQLTGFVTGWGAINYVGIDEDGRMLAIWWTSSTGWNADVLLDSESMPAGPLTGHTASDGSISILGVAHTGEVLRLWWMPGSSWTLSNLSTLAAG